LRGGEYTTLAAPRPLCNDCGRDPGSSPRSSPSPPRREAGSGHECPNPASPLLPSSSSAPPHPNLRRGSCIGWAGQESPKRGDSRPARGEGQGPQSRALSSQPRDPRPPTSSSSSPSRPSLAGREERPGPRCTHACPGSFAFGTLPPPARLPCPNRRVHAPQSARGTPFFMGIPRSGRRALTHPAGFRSGIQRGGGLSTWRGQVPPRRRSPPIPVHPSLRPLSGARGWGFRRTLPGRPHPAVRPRRDRPTPRGVPRPMVGLETPQGTDRAVRLSPTLPDLVPFPSAPQVTGLPVYFRGAPSPEVPTPQAAEALGFPPLYQGHPNPRPPHSKPGCSRHPHSYLPRAIDPGGARPGHRCPK